MFFIEHLTLFLTGAGPEVPGNAPLSHRVRLKTVLCDTVYPGLRTTGDQEPESFLTTLPPGTVYQTPPNLTWVWLITGSLFRACLLCSSWRSEAKPFLFFVPHNDKLTGGPLESGTSGERSERS
jgi:hypothetical protein